MLERQLTYPSLQSVCIDEEDVRAVMQKQLEGHSDAAIDGGAIGACHFARFLYFSGIILTWLIASPAIAPWNAAGSYSRCHSLFEVLARWPLISTPHFAPF